MLVVCGGDGLHAPHARPDLGQNLQIARLLRPGGARPRQNLQSARLLRSGIPSRRQNLQIDRLKGVNITESCRLHICSDFSGPNVQSARFFLSDPPQMVVLQVLSIQGPSGLEQTCRLQVLSFRVPLWGSKWSFCKFCHRRWGPAFHGARKRSICSSVIL